MRRKFLSLITSLRQLIFFISQCQRIFKDILSFSTFSWRDIISFNLCESFNLILKAKLKKANTQKSFLPDAFTWIYIVEDGAP